MQDLVDEEDGDPAENIFVKAAYGPQATSSLEQRNGLDHHVGVCEQLISSGGCGQFARDGRMMGVVAVEERVERRGIDERRHQSRYASSSTAS